eukprot:321894_1
MCVSFLLFICIVFTNVVIGADNKEAETPKELLGKYNLVHIYNTLVEHRFDDAALWLDIDQQIWEKMKLLDSDRIRFKKLQNELRKQKQTNVEKTLKFINPIITFCFENMKLVTAIASGFIFPAIIWLYNKLMKKTHKTNKEMEERKSENISKQNNKTPQNIMDTSDKESKETQPEEIDVKYVILKAGEYQFQLSGSDKAIDIQGHYAKVGASLILKNMITDNMDGYACHQVFHVKKQEDEWFAIQNRNSGLYWKIEGLKDNCKLIQGSFVGSPNSMFRYVECEGGCLIQVKHSGKYISVKNGSKVSGANMVQSNRKQPFVCRKI